MASRKTTETTTEPNIAEAAEKASLVIRGLQSRLRQPRAAEPVEESHEQLEQQLQQYFAKTTPQSSGLIEIRSRVVDGVVEKIMRQWDNGSSIESDVIERLIARVMERFSPAIRP